MSCVWKGLIKKLNLHYKPLTLYNLIKKNNIKTHNVHHNGLKPSEQQLEENYNRIEKLNHDEVLDGYYCSSFDPLLFLVCELYRVTIMHKYNNVMCIYEYKKSEIDEEDILHSKDVIKKKKKKKKNKITINESIPIIKCFSDSGHFW